MKPWCRFELKAFCQESLTNLSPDSLTNLFWGKNRVLACEGGVPFRVVFLTKRGVFAS
jgi:hypothetical protein